MFLNKGITSYLIFATRMCHYNIVLPFSNESPTSKEWLLIIRSTFSHILRKERNAHGSGVLIVPLRNDIIADPQNNLNTTCEIICTKLHFSATQLSIWHPICFCFPFDVMLDML